MTPAKKKLPSIISLDVPGYCPACGNPTLQTTTGNRITCIMMDCPRPDSAAEILDDGETAHIVVLEFGGFTIRHPLIERLDDALLSCALHSYLLGQGEAFGPSGRYRVVAGGNDWIFTRIEDPE
jgi:hypothetical protein